MNGRKSLSVKNTSRDDTRGSAIVMALFVVAFVAIATTAMLTRLQQDIKRTAALLKANQAYLIKGTYEIY